MCAILSLTSTFAISSPDEFLLVNVNFHAVTREHNYDSKQSISCIWYHSK